MHTITKMFAGAAGLAAIASAAPAAAQYYPYGYSTYNPYGSVYGAYNAYTPYTVNPAVAAQQCTAAVQSRLYNRTSLASILGSLIGIPTNSYGRVLSVNREIPTRSGGMRITGLASSGRTAYNNYGPYGVGAYGSLAYGYSAAADLSFRCDVDSRGYVRDVDINRRY
ncbi:hypothetical protein [Sphingomonas segetis]|jgi:hypothetical protein|uniref:hypothetical protein n=1 Tax=Sphingomonas segetis TaxID=1104779 RepID=UPI0012D2BE20|nr:hypothetical protein [Sphingomonas segetis]